MHNRQPPFQTELLLNNHTSFFDPRRDVQAGTDYLHQSVSTASIHQRQHSIDYLVDPT